MKREKRTWMCLVLIIILVMGTGLNGAGPAFSAGETVVEIEKTTPTVTTGGALETVVDVSKPPEVLQKIEIQKSQELPPTLDAAKGIDKTLTTDVQLAQDVPKVPSAALGVNEWAVADFKYESITLKDAWDVEVTRVAISGFSPSGAEKFKTNKAVVLSSFNTVGEPVTAIKAEAFLANKKASDLVNGMKSVVIPSTVKEIQDNAFIGNALTDIQLTGNIEYIGKFAFAQNLLKSVSFGEKLDTISAGAFYKNSVKSVTLPRSLRNLLGREPVAEGAAKDIVFSKLDEMIIAGNAVSNKTQLPDLIKAILAAENFKTTILKADEITFKQAMNLTKDIKKAMPAVLKSIVTPPAAFAPLGASVNEAKKQLPIQVIVLDTENIEHIASVSDWTVTSFNGSQLGSYEARAVITLPSNLSQPSSPIPLNVMGEIRVINAIESQEDFTYAGPNITGFSDLGKEKFRTCKIVTLPSKTLDGKIITGISDKAFLGEIATMQDESVGINVVTIPSTVVTIGAEAFRYNALKSVNIPNGVTNIKTMAFNGNLLQSLELPSSVTTLGAGAFTLNKIASLKLTGNLKTITAAFSYNKLVNVIIPEGVTRIDDMAFGDNDLKTAVLPKSLQYLSGFNNNEFATITIPEGVKELGKKAFARNRIKEITIPSNVKTIGESAFQNSWHDVYLEKITLNEGLEKLDKFAFSSNYLREVELPSTLKTIDSSAFYKNIGYNDSRVTYLYTKNNLNSNGLTSAKYHVINPAKLTMSYVLKGKEVKAETLLSHPKLKTVFSIGDTVKIAPSYKNTAFELVDPSEVEIKLMEKENKLVFQLKDKTVQDQPAIETIGHVNTVAVPFGSNQGDVMKRLAKKGFVFDSNGKEYSVDLSWQLPVFDGTKAGEYTAKASFATPVGLAQTATSLRPELETLVIVKENPAVLKSSIWNVDDFIIKNEFINNDDQVAIMGFSPQGEEKLKTNKALVIPKANKNGELITLIAKEAFENKGLTSLVIPEGLTGLEIDAAAFQENQLTSVILPDGVKEIETYAFFSNNLRTLEIPKTVWKIGNRAFADNKLVNVDFSLDIENVFLDRFSFDNNQLMEVTIVKEVGKIHSEAFKDNVGYGNNKNRVKIYTLNLNVEDQNHVFPFSPYHEMILLKIENIADVPGLKDHVELTLSNGDKVKVNEGKCKSEDFNKKRKEQQANKNKPGGGTAGATGTGGTTGNGKVSGSKVGADGKKTTGANPSSINPKGIPQNLNGEPIPAGPAGKLQGNAAMLPNKTVFRDMGKSQWAQDAVHELWSKKIVSGYKSEFKPESKMTKAEFASILVKAFEIDDEGTATNFADVKKSDWHYDAVSKLVALEIISGDGSGKFNPNEPISREQMIKMLMQLMNSRYPERMNSSEKLARFKDQGKVSSWAEDAFGQAMSLDLISGFSDDTLKPQAQTTRAQAAVVVQKALKLVE